MISAGVEGRLPYMTYPEPWRGPPKQPPEFLRPAPKPLPSRYNGLTNPSPNGARLAHHQQRPSNKYSPPAAAPVNLTQHKDEITEDLSSYSYSRLFQTPPYSCCHPNPYQNIYHQSPYTSILRPNFVPPPPLSPLETYSTATCTATNSGTFLSPSTTYSPPSGGTKANQSLLRDRTTPSTSFKIPSGKEGSLKHRILIRPEDSGQRSDPQKSIDAHGIPENCRKRLTATISSPPPHSPTKTLNNNAVPANFKKGSLIQLTSGELRKVEDIRTEDFVSSAENSPELRLADSTVVKIEENPIVGTVIVTLTYNQRRTQADVEYPLEHPFFVYGKGWASCNVERTFQCFRLKVHHLQVGDIIISLTPRTSSPQTVTTTTTTVHQFQTGHQTENLREQHIGFPSGYVQANSRISSYNQTMIRADNKQTLSPDSMARKRRWSAPDQICDEDECNRRKAKIE